MANSFTKDKEHLVVFYKQLQHILPNVIQTICSQYLEQYVIMLINASSGTNNRIELFNELYKEVISETKSITQKFAQKLSHKFAKRYEHYFNNSSVALFPTRDEIDTCLYVLSKLIVCLEHSESNKKLQEILTEYSDHLNPFSPSMNKLTTQITKNLDELSKQLNTALHQTLKQTLDGFESHSFSSKEAQTLRRTQSSMRLFQNSLYELDSSHSSSKSTAITQRIRRSIIAHATKQFTSEYVTDQIVSLALLPNLLILKTFESDEGVGTLPDVSLIENTVPGSNTTDNKSSNASNKPSDASKDFLKNLCEERLLTRYQDLSQQLEKDLNRSVHQFVNKIHKKIVNYQSTINILEDVLEKTTINVEQLTRPTHIKKNAAKLITPSTDIDTYCSQLKSNLTHTLNTHGTKLQVANAVVNSGLFTFEDLQIPSPQKQNVFHHIVKQQTPRSFFPQESARSAKPVDIIADKNKISVIQP